jgi:hypothetical protein
MLSIATCGRTTIVISIPPNPEGETEQGGASGSIFRPNHWFHIHFQFEYIVLRAPSILHVSHMVSNTGKIGEMMEVTF